METKNLKPGTTRLAVPAPAIGCPSCKIHKEAVLVDNVSEKKALGPDAAEKIEKIVLAMGNASASLKERPATPSQLGISSKDCMERTIELVEVLKRLARENENLHPNSLDISFITSPSGAGRGDVLSNIFVRAGETFLGRLDIDFVRGSFSSSGIGTKLGDTQSVKMDSPNAAAFVKGFALEILNYH